MIATEAQKMISSILTSYSAQRNFRGRRSRLVLCNDDTRDPLQVPLRLFGVEAPGRGAGKPHQKPEVSRKSQVKEQTGSEKGAHAEHAGHAELRVLRSLP